MSSGSAVVDVYEYSGDKLVGTSIAFLALNIIFVVLRLVARRTVKSRLEGDDYLVLGALFANLILEPLCIALVYVGGVGRHVEYWIEIEQDPGILVNWGKILLAVEQTYLLANLFAKLAILVMYIRIFTSKSALYTSYTLAGIVIAAWLGSTVAGLAQCRPFWCAYDKSQPQNCTCIDILAFFRYISLPNIITDVVMLILPLPTIWALKLSRSQKLGLTGAFLTGSIGLVASCVRFAIFFGEDALADPTWKSAFLNVWTVTEPSTYLIAACLPVLRPLLRKIRGGPSTTHNMSSSYKNRSAPTGNSSTNNKNNKYAAMARLASSRRFPSNINNSYNVNNSQGSASDEQDLVHAQPAMLPLEMELEMELGQVRRADSAGTGLGMGMDMDMGKQMRMPETSELGVAREERCLT